MSDMNETNIHVRIKPLPESERLGGFRATPRVTTRTDQIYWDVYFNDRSVGQLDGISVWQVKQVLRAMTKVEDLAADDTRAEIRTVLGVNQGAR